MKKLLVNLIYPLAVVLLVLFVWYLACWWIQVDLILPTPYQAFVNIKEYLKDKVFWISLGWTYLRCLESFMIAFVLALVASVLAYAFSSVERLFNPLMAIIRSIPTMAILLILIIVIQPNQTPIVVAGIVIGPTLYQAFLTGFHQIDLQLVEMANVYHVPKKNQIFKFYIPTMLPVILENTATSFSLNIKLVIAAEAMAQTRNSIGKLMQFAKVNIEIEKLFALTILAMGLSMISEALIRLLKKRICHD